MKRSTEAERRGGFEANEYFTHEKRPRHRPCPPAEIVCRISSCRKSKKKKNVRLRSIQTLVHDLATHARAEEESERPQILCCSTFDRVGRQKPLARRRERARPRSETAPVSRLGFQVQVGGPPETASRSAPIGASGGMASDAAPALESRTREYRGRRRCRRDARGEGSDRQTECPARVCQRILGTSVPSSSRGGGHTAGSVTQPAPRQGSVAPARFFFRFRRFR